MLACAAVESDAKRNGSRQATEQDRTVGLFCFPHMRVDNLGVARAELSDTSKLESALPRNPSPHPLPIGWTIFWQRLIYRARVLPARGKAHRPTESTAALSRYILMRSAKSWFQAGFRPRASRLALACYGRAVDDVSCRRPD